jgi:hypothetical protein
MSRVVLIHWNAEEGEERARSLERAGHEVRFLAPAGVVGLRPILDDPPDALVIDLSRLPSQGCGVGVMLRQRKATRNVPVVFVEGEPAKVERVRRQLPDAVYTEWRRIRGALRRAIERPPASPVVRGTMEAYAGTPLAKKLGIKSGIEVSLLGAPRGYERTLEPLPEKVCLRRRVGGHVPVVVLFAKSRAELKRRLPGAKRSLAEEGRLWIAWPKKTSELAGDLTQQVVRSVGLKSGLVDYRISAFDDTWSGLCFARRRRS